MFNEFHDKCGVHAECFISVMHSAAMLFCGISQTIDEIIQKKSLLFRIQPISISHEHLIVLFVK